MDKNVRCMDQMLGYRGQDRFVLFYYEPRGEEVVWRDSRSYGFATGAWSTFVDEVAPVAEHYNVDVGCQGVPGKHVLLIDRSTRRAFFAVRGDAIRFLSQIAQGLGDDGFEFASHDDLKVPPAMMEITPATITQLAHEIWERKGRLEGRDLENWLEAEAALQRGMLHRKMNA